MFKTAFRQFTQVVPGRGKAYVRTGPSVGKSPKYPYKGASSIPAKIMNSRMATAMQAAENMDMKEIWFSVLGTDITMPIIMAMTEKMTVQREWSDRVLRILAPVRTWKPIKRILLARSMKPENS